jgi:hypothetical protein
VNWSGNFTVVLLLCLLAGGTQISPAQQEDKILSIGQAAENAVAQSQITLPGATPFHLKAEVRNVAKPGSEYTATIEEYWISPSSWRRTIESAAFSQTLVVDGTRVSEQDRGDYYPFWLRDLVTAVFDPLPMSAQLQNFRGTIALPTDSEESSSCVNVAVPAGVPPVKAQITYAFCFSGQRGLLKEVRTPEYKARFEHYQMFHGKMVSRRITEDLAPDAIMEARITTLDDGVISDRALLSVDQSTPPDAQLKSQQVGEATARAIAVAAPDLIWPPVREGKNSGTLSVYISADKLGHVREVWPVAADNPELMAPAQQQLLHWRFKPYVNGVPMQMESVLTFAFNAVMGAPISLLSNVAARKLASHVVEPHLHGSGTVKPAQLTFRIRVDEHGTVFQVLNTGNAAPAIFAAAERALKQWRFRPYLRGDKADRFDADIAFTVQPKKQ